MTPERFRRGSIPRQAQIRPGWKGEMYMKMKTINWSIDRWDFPGAENTRARAVCCRSDLRFLLSILPEDSPHREKVESRLRQIEGNPTDEQINAAWQLAAIIHDEIRKAR